MRLFTENTEQYIHLLAGALSKDPASLESWKCVRIRPHEGSTLDLYALAKLKETHTDMDGDVVACKDGDVFLISREISQEKMDDLADMIATYMSDDAPTIDNYDLFFDWRKIRAAMLVKTSGTVALAVPELESADFGDTGALSAVFADAKQKRKSRHPQYVLVVEDDPLTRRIVGNALKENYAVISATDAREAIAQYLMYAPDVVFLDIGLPDVSGFAVLKQIVASDPDAYVVMFSGNSYLDNVTKALSHGASGFIAKPFKKDRIQRYIEDSALHHHKYA